MRTERQFKMPTVLLKYTKTVRWKRESQCKSDREGISNSKSGSEKDCRVSKKNIKYPIKTV